MHPKSGRLSVFVAVLFVVMSACTTATPQAGSSPAPTTASTPAPTADPWVAIVAAAKTEGKATIYTTEVPAWVDSVTGGFKQATGLDMITGLRGASGTIEQKLLADARASAIATDLFSVIDRDYFTANKNLFINLKDAGLPNYNSYPAEAKWQDICVVNKTSVTGLLYNNKLVPADKAPKQWNDLLDPYWKGKFMLIDPRASNSPMGWAVQMQKAYGMNYLAGIKAQQPALNTSTAPAAEAVASGAYLVTVTSQADSSSALRANGAPLTFVVPSQGPTLGNAACMGILKDGKSPNAAKVLLNYLMTKDAQSLACKAGVEVQSPVDADGCYKVPAGWKPTPVDLVTGAIEGTTDDALKKSILAALGIN